MTNENDIPQPHRGLRGPGHTAFTPGDLSPARDRLLINWPQTEVALDVPVTESDFAKGRQWPPPQGRNRTKRLDTYHSLYRGDASDFHEDQTASRVMINYFSRLCKIVAMAATYTLNDDSPRRAVEDSIIDAFKFGRSYLAYLDGAARWFDTRQCWKDGEDSEILWAVQPYVSARSRDGRQDRADIYWIVDDGAFTWQQGLQDGRWTSDRTEPEALDGTWDLVDLPPTQGGWGESAFDDLISPVVSMALLLSDWQYATAANANPTTIVPLPEKQAARFLGGDTEPQTIEQWMRSDINRGLSDAFQSGAFLWDSTGRTQPFIVEWGSTMEASDRLHDILLRAVRMLTGLPQASEAEQGDTPSGTAIERLAMMLRWQIVEVWKQYIAAFDYFGVPIDWTNPDAGAMTTGTDNEGPEAQGVPGAGTDD